MEEKIRARRDQLIKDRDAFVADANGRVNAVNAVIAELTLLIEPETIEPTSPEKLAEALMSGK
jgi:hypothetical protein